MIVDDTEDNISTKIKKFNLIGVPYQIIIGKKTEVNTFEFKEIGKTSKIMKIEHLHEIAKIIKNNKN